MDNSRCAGQVSPPSAEDKGNGLGSHTGVEK